MTRSPQDLLPGSLDLLVLQSMVTEERHGFAVSQWVRETTGGVLETPDAALYKALHRLEDRGLLSSRWGRSENRRKAKYYRLTSKGRDTLAQERTTWSLFAGAMERALGSES